MADTANTSRNYKKSYLTYFLVAFVGLFKVYKEIFFFTGLPCVLPRESESVLVGSAILGACASGDFSSVQVSDLTE